MDSQPKRFRDYDTALSNFEREVWVSCPQCQQAARSLCFDQAVSWRVTCTHCAYSKTASRRASQRRPMPWWRTDWWGEYRQQAGAIDPLFGLPLWLQTPCCGHVLWAYNADHLDFLEGYIAATIRERQGGKGNHHGIAVRLPRWMKLAKHRPELLKAIQKLQQRSHQLRSS